METISFEISSNEEIWDTIDKRFNHIFIHKFWPHQVIEWWKTSLRMDSGKVYDLNVRNMEFDIQTDLVGLSELLRLNTQQLRIYQFDKAIPSTLVLEHIPENNAETILKQNGLQHSFFCDFERLTISSYDETFIENLKKLRF